MNRLAPADIPETLIDGDTEHSYEVSVTASGAGCTAANFCIRSLGKYYGTRRSIEIEY